MSEFNDITQKSLYMMENNTERIKTYRNLVERFNVSESQARDIFDIGANFGVKKCFEVMKKPKEFILCSAIMYDGTVISGRRHKDCYETLERLRGISEDDDRAPGREDQGFLTSTNRYVDRKEAWKIADENNQIKFGREASYRGEDSELISENLYWDE
ncbi:MAG: hypothetical protein ACTSQA_06800 [Candidatus Heimdallarchaeaceae archaeon]